MDFMSLLGSVVQGTMASSPMSGKRISNAAGGVQDLLGSLMGAGQAVTQKVGGDNLAAGGVGALLGTLLGGSGSTTKNALGGSMMGLLGMMAYKALSNSNSVSASSASNSVSDYKYVQPSVKQQESDAEIILTAMIDAAKADGRVDANEINKIMSNIQSSGAGQDGVEYVLKKLQGPMETSKIAAAVKGRPELAVQVYSASLMAIKVDTDAERKYLDGLAKVMGLSSSVVNNIEALVERQ